MQEEDKGIVRGTSLPKFEKPPVLSAVHRGGISPGKMEPRPHPLVTEAERTPCERGTELR